jgi:hypothetical protein
VIDPATGVLARLSQGVRYHERWMS